MKSARSVHIEIRPSRIAGAWIALTHLATAALLAWLPLHGLLRSVAIIAVGAHCIWAIRASSLRSLRSSIVAAELAADRRVALMRRDGRRIDGSVLPQSYVGEWLATVIVRRDGRRRSLALLLLPDMVDAEDLRRFRVLLRLSRPEQS